MTAALGAAKVHFLWATAILTVIILAVVAVFIRRGIQSPISRLCAGTRRIAAGDLDSRVMVGGHDELAELAEAFNRMAEDLAAARREVTGWSQNLEQKWSSGPRNCNRPSGKCCTWRRWRRWENSRQRSPTRSTTR